MATPTQAEINRVVNGYNRASEAPGYAETIICEMQQVNADNYQTVWSTEYNGSFKSNK